MGHRQQLIPSDLILVCCSNDLRVADRAVELYREVIKKQTFLIPTYVVSFILRKGLAPRVLFSGGRGNFTEAWEEPEAVLFARRAEELGVEKDAILIETTSSNTGENIKNSHGLLTEKGFLPRKIILVQKPFMERRFAVLEMIW